MLVKLEWLRYRMVTKLWRYVEPFSYNTSVSRTDRQTDRRTDRIGISISRVSSRMLTRDKNCSRAQTCVFFGATVFTYILYKYILLRNLIHVICVTKYIRERIFNGISAKTAPGQKVMLFLWTPLITFSYPAPRRTFCLKCYGCIFMKFSEWV